MADFFQLTVDGRREALEVAAAASGRPIHLLEKDIWVVWALNHLFGSPFADHLVFKGGTSLSKAYNVIRRFSEDVDITYDIRAIASDLIDGADSPLPATRSQEKRWTKEIRSRLSQWVSGSVLPHLSAALAKQGLPATARADGEKLFIEYTALATGTGYVSPVVMLEFGARSTGEPSEVLNVVCDAAAHLPSVQFPTSASKVMRAERTFWEKATAIHVFCAQGIFRGGDRFARHWHDLARLASAGYANPPLPTEPCEKPSPNTRAYFLQRKISRATRLITTQPYLVRCSWFQRKTH